LHEKNNKLSTGTSGVYGIYLFLWKSSLKLLKIHKVI